MKKKNNQYGPDSFARADETDDALFYAADRFVSHVDSRALATIEDLIEHLVVEEKPIVLDLMAGGDSHIRRGLQATTIGLGLNQNELAQNPALLDYRLHDLNRDSNLPFPDEMFDAVICSLSVDYMTRPMAVFFEVARILKPGGLFLLIFSNRFFPQKVVKIWQDSSEEERVALVRDWLEGTDAFGPVGVYASKNFPRPKDDKYAALGIPSDPVYAVFADRRGGPVKHRPLPEQQQQEHRAIDTGDRSICPHCGEKLKKWEVPQTPFTEWPSEYQYVCFNDECPYFIRGWETMTRQGNPGSYRFMYDPTTKKGYSIPVLDKNSLKAGICRDDPSQNRF